MRIEDVFTQEEQLSINKKFVQFDPGNGRKALIVPVEALDGLEAYWENYARHNNIAILPYRGSALTESALKEEYTEVNYG